MNSDSSPNEAGMNTTNSNTNKNSNPRTETDKTSNATPAGKQQQQQQQRPPPTTDLSTTKSPVRERLDITQEQQQQHPPSSGTNLEQDSKIAATTTGRTRSNSGRHGAPKFQELYPSGASSSRAQTIEAPPSSTSASNPLPSIASTRTYSNFTATMATRDPFATLQHSSSSSNATDHGGRGLHGFGGFMYGEVPSSSSRTSSGSGRGRRFQRGARGGTRKPDAFETWTSKQLRKECSNLKIRGMKNVKKHVMVQALYDYYGLPNPTAQNESSGGTQSSGNMTSKRTNSNAPNTNPEGFGQIPVQNTSRMWKQPPVQEFMSTSSPTGPAQFGGSWKMGPGNQPFQNSLGMRFPPNQQTQSFSNHPSGYNNYMTSFDARKFYDPSQFPYNPQQQQPFPMGHQQHGYHPNYPMHHGNEYYSPTPSQNSHPDEAIILIDIVMSKDFIDRVVKEWRNWQLWVDVRRQFIKVMNEKREKGQSPLDQNEVNSWSSIRLWEMWREITLAYGKACTEFAVSGASESEYIKFCGGRIEVFYLHQRLLDRPDLLQFIKSAEYSQTNESFPTMQANEVMQKPMRESENPSDSKRTRSQSVSSTDPPQKRAKTIGFDKKVDKRPKKSLGEVQGSSNSSGNTTLPNSTVPSRSDILSSSANNVASQIATQRNMKMRSQNSGASGSNENNENDSRGSKEGSTDSTMTTDENEKQTPGIEDSIAEQEYTRLLMQNFESVSDSLVRKKSFLGILRSDAGATDSEIAECNDDILLLSAIKKKLRREIWGVLS